MIHQICPSYERDICQVIHSHSVKSVFILSCTYGLLLIRCHHVVNKGRRLSPSALVAVPVLWHTSQSEFAPSSRSVFWHTSHPVFAPSSRAVFAPLSRPVFGLRASVFAHHLLRLLKLHTQRASTFSKRLIFGRSSIPRRPGDNPSRFVQWILSIE